MPFFLHDGNEKPASSGVLTILVYDGVRRCHAHPHVVISSPCGRFDGLCGECEDGMYREEQEAASALAPPPAPVPVPVDANDDFPF